MKWFRILGFLAALAVFQRAQAQTATVTWTNVHQTIDGFGASDDGTGNLSVSQADLFFSPTNGIGLSFVRSLGNEGCNNTISDLTTLQEAVARGAKVWVTMQSPPVSMKDSGTCALGGLLSGSYGAYATYIVNWIQQLQNRGIPVYAISPVNEPDVAASGTPNNIGGLDLTPQNIHDFVLNNIGPALSSAGLSTKLMIAEEGQWFYSNYPSTTMSDPSAATYVSILASHGYGYYPNWNVSYFGSNGCCSTVTTAPESTATGQLWQSEISGGGPTFDPSITNALVFAQNIHDYMTVANTTGWMYWELINGSCCNDNEGLADVSGNPAKRLYALGNYSKFVRPGWVRIDATTNPQGGIYVSAYKDSAANNVAIVVINQNGSAIAQSFALNGFTTTSVTPWVTSATLNLVQQSSISVSNGAFSYTLPAASVTTFVGTTGGPSAPAPPTNLRTVVQ